MWMERKSSYSTPGSTPPQSRPYSPAPRRRPGLLPRSSSLSLASTPNASSSHLPLPSGRAPNGSSLRNELRNPAPEDVQDPVQVLRSILGAPWQGEHTTQQPADEGQKPPELVEDIEFSGLSLQDFAQSAEDASEKTANVNSITVQSIAEYENEKEKFEDLHKSIEACDQVLKSVESYLTGFQADLGVVSAEIETLQSRSTAMNTKLENRKVVEKLLGPSVEEMSLPPAVVRIISEDAVDENWTRALAELEKRTKAVEAKQKDEQQQKLKALDDLAPLLGMLTDRAIERIRDYLVGQIRSLRSPNINAQVIQLDNFLKYKDLYAFLARHKRKLADEIAQAYINTMRWYYLSQFTRYEAALKSVRLHVVDKNDLIGQQDDPSVRGARKGPATHDPFTIGRRIDSIKTTSRAALSSYLAEEAKTAHYLETPFRSFNLALIDNACFEYGFLSGYFSPSQNFHAISRIFEAIFAPTFSLGQTITKSLTENSTDALGILICVRFNQQMAFELQRRKVPAAEGYVNGTNILLWPRFQQVMDLHCESLKRAAIALSSRTGASTLLSGGSSNSSAVQGTAPHPLTQRFGGFLQGVLALSSEAGDDEPVARSLSRLTKEYESFLAKLCSSIAETRKRERFLFNNYSLLGTILEGAQGKLADDNRRHFEELKEKYRADS